MIFFGVYQIVWIVAGTVKFLFDGAIILIFLETAKLKSIFFDF
jgi:hypothetical protein